MVPQQSGSAPRRSRGQHPHSSRTTGQQPARHGGKSVGQRQRMHHPQKSTARRTGDTDRHKPHPPRGIETGKLRIIVVGGNEEVGRNMTILEYGQDIIIIDLGLQFPEEDMPGIDYVIPNTSYLKGKEGNIRGVVITHGHYDHIGAIPHLIGGLGNPPIYGTPLTIGIIKKRQTDFPTAPPLNTTVVQNRQKIKLGVFTVEFVLVSHNIPDSMGIIITTPVGKFFHTGDFKIDLDPAGDKPADMERIQQLGKENIIALLSDSTNAPVPGRQFTEKQIEGNLGEIFATVKGRFIIGTFASNLGRVQQILGLCEKYNRKIILDGYSMKTNVEIAKELGYIKTRVDSFITYEDMKKYPPERIAIVCTGAQGEGRAVLMRIANREHRFVRIEPGDTVIFSSSVVPGNERSVQRLTDVMYREGAEVINYKMMDIHAGGHAKQEDLQDMIKMVKPKYLIPIEGNHSFLHQHARTAQAIGFPRENIFIADNGQIMEFTKEAGRLTDMHVPSDYVFVDGLGVGDVSHIIIRERQQLAADGMVVVIVTIRGKTGETVGNPDIISRGFIFMRDHKELIEATRRKVKAVLKDRDSRTPAQEDYLKEKIRNDIGQFLFTRTQRRPMILPVLIEV